MMTVYRSRTFGLFGFRIPYLPDFLADHTLLGDSDELKLAESCRRWEYFVGSLWSIAPQAAYELRYTFDPARGATEVLLLGRVSDGDAAARIAEGLGRSLAALRVPSAPLALEELTGLRYPRAGHVFEVRQAEQRVSVRTAEFGRAAEGYLVLPWWGPGGAFLGPVTALAAGSSAKVVLAIVLQPTELTEGADLAELAARMATAAGTPTQGAVWGTEVAHDVHSLDPQAEWLGRVHAANLRRLHRPFLITAYALSDDAVAARGVAGALAAAIGDERPFEPPIGEPSVIPSRADVVELNDEQREDALRAVGELEFHFAQPTYSDGAESAVQRLRYLCDSRGAATAFRLPVSVRGGVPGITTMQRSPDFHPGPRIGTCPADHLALGTYEDGGLATIPVADLTKHVLVTGFTGSGKTVTVLQLLHQLWADHQVPFLVLESAKQEYRGLFGVQDVGRDLRVYTLGNETGVPFRLNPFELLPGVRVEAHLSRLQVCLEAAVPPIGPSSSVIAEALLRVYEACGWALTDVYPEDGSARRRFPRLSEFVTAVEQVIVDRKYAGEVLSNLTAALVGRFRPLLLGSKRRMFDTPRSAPSAADLFQRPTVLELNDLNVDDKALVVMFVLTFLREHREREFRRGGCLGALAHVTLVEEAHNVLENVASKGSGEGATSADTRFKAVEAFCQLLTEIRALGEGLIIADQSPEKLAPDALRNTNLQIAHQLRDGNDRAAIANAMIMTDEQRDFLGKLPPGQAAVFRTGLEQATFVRVPKYYPSAREIARCPKEGEAAASYRRSFRGWGFESNLADAEVVRLMAEREPEAEARRELSLPYAGCEHCNSKCRYRDAIAADVGGAVRPAEIAAFHTAYDDAAVPEIQVWHLATAAAHASLKRVSLPVTPDAGWCHFLHAWHGRYGADPGPKHMLTATIRKTFLTAFSSAS